HTTEKFRNIFNQLPKEIQNKAQKAYALWKKDPSHPSLQFKPIQSNKSVYSVRIDRDWRVLGIKEDGFMVWFWIGSHSDYGRLIGQL
ncbi:MAG: hypothetical protein FD167_869, partial [bacterium]